MDSLGIEIYSSARFYETGIDEFGFLKYFTVLYGD